MKKPQEACYCNDNHALVIDRRSVSRITSCIAICAFVIFALGYFIGKRQVLQRDNNAHDLALFANKIQYALDKESYKEKQHEATSNSRSVMTESANFLEPYNEVPVITAGVQEPIAQSQKRYAALLAGYGTLRSAQQLVDRLKNKGILTEIRTRVSTNGQKKSRTWYQVVTSHYEKKEDLVILVEHIKKLERLGQGVRIVEIA